MSYQSFGFIVFSAAVVLIYYTIGCKKQPWVLAFANLAFYAFSGIEYIPFLLATMLVTFFAGKKIGLIYEVLDAKLAEAKEMAEKKELRGKAKQDAKKILTISIVISVILLGVCKYTGFVLENINMVLSLFKVPQIEMFNMILPVGISFYTFMAISYVLDIYWKRYKYEKNFLMYAVYLSYFPHVVQGPIDRFNEIKQQISQRIEFSYENLTFGAKLALWGFFKKIVLADRLGVFIGNVLGEWQNYNGLSLSFAIVLFSIQIYADFSGCIDIVTGVSEMLGIKLRANFNHPYFSKTMGEFWRRWHISLQEWFKDYIYYPVSVSSFNKKMKKRFKEKGQKRAEELFASCFPVLVVWLITGIWHGASWNYVVWGLFHASLLIGSQVFEPISTKINAKLHIKTESFLWRLWQMTRTFILCCIGRIFFRAPSFSIAFAWIKKMFTEFSISAFIKDFNLLDIDIHSNASIYAYLLSHIIPCGIVAYAIVVLWSVDMAQERMNLRETLSKKNIMLRWILLFGLIFSVLVFGSYGPGYNHADFIYQRF